MVKKRESGGGGQKGTNFCDVIYIQALIEFDNFVTLCSSLNHKVKSYLNHPEAKGWITRTTLVDHMRAKCLRPLLLAISGGFLPVHDYLSSLEKTFLYQKIL